MKDQKTIKKRLNYLRGEIQNQRISYMEIAELQSLKSYIQESDITLRAWVEIPELER